jgi:hypothetical protein
MSEKPVILEENSEEKIIKRLSINVSEDTLKMIKFLQGEYDQRTYINLINLSINVLNWLTEKSKNGNTVMAIKKLDNSLMLSELPYQPKSSKNSKNSTELYEFLSEAITHINEINKQGTSKT